MKIRIDTHTHSLASGHAYSTIDDNARGARRNRLHGFVLTDHGPSMPGGTHQYHFGNLRILPDRIGGVRFYRGVEANIMDDAGSIDLPPCELLRLDFVMAGFHEICLAPKDAAFNTRAMVAAIANPYVDAISHPGNPAFPVDLEAVVAAAGKYGKALEINNSSFRVRLGCESNCLRVAQLCASIGVRVVVGSDAHYWQDVGRFDKALEIVKAAGISERQVLNADAEGFESFMAERKAARKDLASRAV